jgi:chromatin segregation and condensation protein Rec8/ScpA/Scc1 (kleisin family)
MDHLTIFIAVTAAAVVLQALILVAMFLSMRKTASKVEVMTEEVKTKVLPTVDLVHSTLVEIKPRIETIVANASESSTLLKAQIQRLDATITDIVDRTRLQVIRADELVNRTMDRVEDATEVVHNTVVSPVRQMSGLMHGFIAALEYLRNGKRRGGVNVPQDEMFI